MQKPKIVVFTCNWGAYHGLEAAGRQQRQYPVQVRPVRVNCIGRLTPGILLKALAKGARGVLALGCPQGECHYGSGNRQAEETFATAGALAALLGFAETQLQLAYVAAGDGSDFASKVCTFAEKLGATGETS
jgi:coenzyme F420-reducing hydrogenase delta subunit